MPATTSWPSAANSGPRWSIVGIAIACSTRSGTLVGPGICRKWRPVCVGAVFFITTGSLLLDTRVWARNAIPTRHAVLRHGRQQRPPARLRPPVLQGDLEAFPFLTYPRHDVPACPEEPPQAASRRGCSSLVRLGFDSIKKIPHPEEAAKQLSRRTHFADPGNLIWPRIRRRRKSCRGSGGADEAAG